MTNEHETRSIPTEDGQRDSAKPVDSALRDQTVPPSLYGPFVVDFLGGLVPGVLLVGQAVVVLVPPLWALTVACHSPESPPEFLAAAKAALVATKDTPSALWFAVIAIALAVCYVVGHIFFRSDPKDADSASFQRLLRRSKKKEKEEKKKRKQAEDQSDEEESQEDEKRKPEAQSEKDRFQEQLRKDYACDDDDDQFPYLYMRTYLENRGHEHLLGFVDWGEKWGEDSRSKTQINEIKVVLQFFFPRDYRRIVRNEAHVRLSTSTWHVVRALRVISAISVFILILSLTVACLHSRSFDQVLNYLPYSVIPLGFFFLNEFWRMKCEGFVHYQRLREIFYVLQLAYIGMISGNKLLTEMYERKPRDQQAVSHAVPVERIELSGQP